MKPVSSMKKMENINSDVLNIRSTSFEVIKNIYNFIMVFIKLTDVKDLHIWGRMGKRCVIEC